MTVSHYLNTINIEITGAGLMIDDSIARIVKVLREAGYNLNATYKDGAHRDIDIQELELKIDKRANNTKMNVNIIIDELPWPG